MYVDGGNLMYREPREANRGCLVSVSNKTLQVTQLVQDTCVLDEIPKV